jgi:uncharacterized membrane protein
MNKKPITPKMHGFIDYGFATMQLATPELLGFNKKAKRVYRLLSAQVFGYSALTDYPLGIKPVLSYETHHKIDIANVALMAAAAMYRGINKDKRTLAFHLGFVALAAVNVLLTDWKADPHAREDIRHWK